MPRRVDPLRVDRRVGGERLLDDRVDEADVVHALRLREPAAVARVPGRAAPVGPNRDEALLGRFLAPPRVQGGEQAAAVKAVEVNHKRHLRCARLGYGMHLREAQPAGGWKRELVVISRPSAVEAELGCSRIRL